MLCNFRNKDGFISLGELKLANKDHPIRDIAEVINGSGLRFFPIISSLSVFMRFSFWVD